MASLIDFKGLQVVTPDPTGAGGLAIHNNFKIIADDYAHLPGRSGGQTLIGGTAAGDDLTLQSTSDGTKGSVIFGGGTTLYDEVNDRTGIGKSVPVSALHVLRTSNSSEPDQIVARFENDGSQNQVRTAWVVDSDTSANTRLFGMQLFSTATGCGWADYEARPLQFFTGASAGAATQRIIIGTDGKVLIGSTSTAVTALTVNGTITLKEQAAADSDTAAFGQIWGKSTAPTQLMFTTDNGIDHLISPAQSSISSSTDALDVIDSNTVSVSTSGGTVVIGGLANGVLGQVVHIFKLQIGNDLVIEHLEAAGTQKIATPSGTDITLSTFGGVTLVFNGTTWFVISE